MVYDSMAIDWGPNSRSALKCRSPNFDSGQQRHPACVPFPLFSCNYSAGDGGHKASAHYVNLDETISLVCMLLAVARREIRSQGVHLHI